MTYQQGRCCTCGGAEPESASPVSLQQYKRYPSDARGGQADTAMPQACKRLVYSIATRAYTGVQEGGDSTYLEVDVELGVLQLCPLRRWVDGCVWEDHVGEGSPGQELGPSDVRRCIRVAFYPQRQPGRQCRCDAGVGALDLHRAVVYVSNLIAWVSPSAGHHQARSGSTLSLCT